MYDKAQADIAKEIRVLDFAIDDLREQYDWMDDNDPKKEVVRSKIQSKIYQKQYQEQLYSQVSGILSEMQKSQFVTISDYLDKCYEDGFIGSIFDLHGQGVPMMMPINQESMVKAVQLDSKISQGLYTKLGEDVDVLKKRITSEVTRAIATGATYAQTAQRLAGQTKIGYNKAARIARTEGHRIQNSAADDAAHLARDRGADVVKQWDATLDGHTRESHVAVDGQIRELDEEFGNGLLFPGDPRGKAAEVVNCRCAYLQRARWAVGGSFTKMNNFTGEIETFDSPQDYDEFKKSFFSPENKSYMNYVEQMQDKYGTKDFKKVLESMTDREYKHYSKLLRNNPVYNKAAPVAVTPTRKVKVDDFPEVFRKNAQGKKAMSKLADALNADGINPNVQSLYANMGKLPHVPWNGKVSYTASGHKLDRWESRLTGETTRYELKIPKLTGADLIGEKQTAFHEIGHFIDMCCNTKALRSQVTGTLIDVVKRSGASMSDEVKGLFDGFAKGYKTIIDDSNKKYKALRSAITTDYMDGTIPYDQYKKRWNALIREQNAEIDYLARNLMGGGVDALSDIYDALSGGQYMSNNTLIFGHGAKYYANATKRNSEIFANYMSLSVNRPDLVDVLRRDKPDLCAELDKLIEEMVGMIQ